MGHAWQVLDIQTVVLLIFDQYIRHIKLIFGVAGQVYAPKLA